jgi:hypothetical protein
MAADSNTGSGCGWLGLIAVVALLGIGYLYQREGGRIFGPNVQRENAERTSTAAQALKEKEPNGEPRTTDTPPPEPNSAAGGVEVTLVADPWDSSCRADWRLYVNGRIVAGKAEPFRWFVQPAGDSQSSIRNESSSELLRVSMDGSGNPRANRELTFAGEHKFPLAADNHEVKVELVYRIIVINHRGEMVPEFPYRVESRKVQIKAGEFTSVKLPLAFLFQGVPGGKPEYDKFFQCDMAGLTGLEARAEQAQKNLLADPVYQSLSELATTPPGRPTVVVNTGAEGCGTREFDADQVRVLVDWLILKHWGWEPQEIQSPLFLADDARGEAYRDFYPRAKRLKERIRQSRLTLERLKGIAVQLEQMKR